VAAALALSGAVAASASAEVVDIKGGWADWGVKETFRSYIGGAGQISVSDGATRNPDGTFRFPLVGGTLDTETGFGEVQLGGSVNFWAHGGALDITVANPRVVLAETDALLFADSKSLPMGPGEPIDDNRDLIALDTGAVAPAIGATAIQWNEIPATLTGNGAPVFGRYPAGTEMDPLTVVAGFGEKPGLKVRGKARLGKSAKAAVATVRCKTGPCTVVAPKRAKVRVGGKRFNAKVQAPAEVNSGKRAAIAVKVTKRVAKKLAGKKGTVRFAVAVDAGPGAEVKKVVKTKLVGGKKR